MRILKLIFAAILGFIGTFILIGAVGGSLLAVREDGLRVAFLSGIILVCIAAVVLGCAYLLLKSVFGESAKRVLPEPMFEVDCYAHNLTQPKESLKGRLQFDANHQMIAFTAGETVYSMSFSEIKKVKMPLSAWYDYADFTLQSGAKTFSFYDSPDTYFYIRATYWLSLFIGSAAALQLLAFKNKSDIVKTYPKNITEKLHTWFRFHKVPFYHRKLSGNETNAIVMIVSIPFVFVFIVLIGAIFDN